MFATPTPPFPLTPVLFFRHHCCPVHIHPYPHHRSRYGQYDIYFSNILKPSQLERIAEADEHEVVREVQVRILTHPNPGFPRHPSPAPLRSRCRGHFGAKSWIAALCYRSLLSWGSCDGGALSHAPIFAPAFCSAVHGRHPHVILDRCPLSLVLVVVGGRDGVALSHARATAPLCIAATRTLRQLKAVPEAPFACAPQSHPATDSTRAHTHR